jgi:hypothetical protein
LQVWEVKDSTQPPTAVLKEEKLGKDTWFSTPPFDYVCADDSDQQYMIILKNLAGGAAIAYVWHPPLKSTHSTSGSCLHLLLVICATNTFHFASVESEMGFAGRENGSHNPFSRPGHYGHVVPPNTSSNSFRNQVVPQRYFLVELH